MSEAAETKKEQTIRELETEARLAEYNLHQLHVEMNAMKLEFANDNLKWLDSLTQKYPESKDAIDSLSQKLLDQIEHMEKEMDFHFTALMEVSGLSA